MSVKPEYLRSIFDEPRNGANDMFRHPLAKNLVYSDGIKEVADAAGAYWLLDLLGTEFVKSCQATAHIGMGIVTMTVKEYGAVIEMHCQDEAPPVCCRKINYTDFPDGRWVFYMACDDGVTCTLILPSEY